MAKEDIGEGGEKGKEREDGELTDSELEAAAGGRKQERPKIKTPKNGGKNRALFRTLEQDMLFRKIERKGWNR